MPERMLESFLIEETLLEEIDETNVDGTQIVSGFVFDLDEITHIY